MNVNSESSHDKDQYIFKEEDFEDNATAVFNPSVFVLRYSQITLLESLREQLQKYCNELKQNLYLIINRDYQDFINIATKLDGVDNRVEHLRKPLVDLRLDLSNLHDGMVASIQNIQDKLKRKSEVSNKRIIVESTLACIEKFEIVESIIDNKIVNTSNNRKSRRELLRSKLMTSPNNPQDIDIDSFECSELERAAYSLKHAKEYLNILSIKPNQVTSTTSHQPIKAVLATANNNNSNPSIISSPGIHQILINRHNILTDKILNRLTTQLTQIFSISSTELTNNFPKIGYYHCIRGLIALNQNHIIENVIANLIVIPLAKSLLTQGRIDGSGGRGSYQGLSDTIASLINQLTSILQIPIQLTEKYFIDQSADLSNISFPIDIIINSVFLPIIQLIFDRFPTIYSIAIAKIFSICYINYQKIKEFICKNLSYDNINSLKRLNYNKKVSDLDNKWTIDVYYHVRSNEIISLIDQCYEYCYRKGLTSNVYDNHYIGLVSTLITQSIDSIILSITIPNYHISLFKVISIVLVLCQQEEIILTQSLSSQFIRLSVQVMYRLELQICLLMDITSLSYSKETLVHIQQIMNDLSNNSVNNSTHNQTSNVTANQLVTPTKSNNQTPNTTPNTNKYASTSLTLEEIVLLASDINTLILWIQQSLDEYMKKKIIGLIPNHLPEENIILFKEKVEKVVEISLRKTVFRFVKLRDVVWNKALSQVANECKKHLNGVKVIAGKYRMTNKPPPDSPSPYVELILQPIKQFLDNHAYQIKSFISLNSFEIEIIEDVTKYFIIQIQSLMETVKQMDSALQRRTKLRTTTSNLNNNISNTMSDSEKISLQVFLDVKSYGEEIKKLLNINLNDIKSFLILTELVNDSQNSHSNIDTNNS